MYECMNSIYIHMPRNGYIYIFGHHNQTDTDISLYNDTKGKNIK